LQCNGSGTPLDFSNDITINMLVNCTGATSGETLSIAWAQAALQSPLDLGRLPR